MAEQKTVVASKRWTIDWRDLLNGLAMAVYAAVGTQVAQIIWAWATTYKYEWDIPQLILMGKFALATAVAYLFKKFKEKSRLILINPSKQTVESVKEAKKNDEPVIVSVETPTIQTIKN